MSTVAKLAKLKRCRMCPTEFRPWTSTQIVCSVRCSKAWGEQQEQRRLAKAQRAAERREREARRERKARLREIEPLPKVIARTQAAFNAYIRERDYGLPCISCGATNPPERFGGAWDCGHFRTVGAAPELRFDERNAHKQCKACNGGSGNFSHKAKTVSAEYRERLIQRIGLAAVEELEGPHEAKHYTREQLESLARHYRAEARRIRRERGA